MELSIHIIGAFAVFFPLFAVLLPLHGVGAQPQGDKGDTCSIRKDSETKKRTLLSILCYGDSLTAGEVRSATGTRQFFPYADHLRHALQSSGDSLEYSVQVDHIGLCGWTTDNMLGVLDDPQNGLRHALQKQLRKTRKKDHDQDSGSGVEEKDDQEFQHHFVVVVILAGTNDLWPQNRNPTHDNIDEVTNHVLQNLIRLHQVWDIEKDCDADGGCGSNTIDPKMTTIAIGIPSSVYQVKDNPAALQVRTEVNQQLSQLAAASRDKELLYVPFPFDYHETTLDSDVRKYWSHDGIHFSQQGYQLLAETVARAILDHVLKQ